MNMLIVLGILAGVVLLIVWIVKTGLVKRGAKIAEANANAAMDKLEDPVIMSEQIIRDMSGSLERGLEGQAQYKASIKLKEKEIAELKASRDEWNLKADKLAKKIQNNEITKEEATEAIATCLNNVENINMQIQKDEMILAAQNKKYEEFSKKTTDLKEKIKKASDELKQLKADYELAKVNKEVGKEFANIDGVNNYTSQLHKLREKVDADMALGDAFADLDKDNRTAEDKVNELLKKDSPTANSKIVEDFLSKYQTK